LIFVYNDRVFVTRANDVADGSMEDHLE